MGKRKDLSPRKKGQISVLLEVRGLKQKDITKKLNLSTQTVSSVKKKLDLGRNLGSSRKENCGRKKKTTPRLDRKVKAITLKDRRASCKKLSIDLAKQGYVESRRTINNCLLEQGLKSYRPRRKPRLTEKMKQARYQWTFEQETWTSEDWLKVIRVTLRSL